MPRIALAFAIAHVLCACQSPANGSAHPSDAIDSSRGTGAGATTAMRVEQVAHGLDHPWAVALLPDRSFLVTERPGRMRRVSADGTPSPPLRGVPTVFAEGQGGLLDVVLAPDFATSRRIYFSYAEPGADGTAGTAAAYATLGDDALSGVHVFYRQEPKVEGGNHFGSRIAFDRAGHVFVSQGERFSYRMYAQQLDKLQGKLVRLNLDGSIPADNPFVGHKDARPEIWSYGHRNMQGLAIDPRTGTLWESEHGPRGGDEINLPLPGKNYGWPLVTYGIDYSGLKYPETIGTSAPGMEQPHHYWPKSPGLSGMAFYTGHPGSPWNDSLFLGSLAESNLIRLTLRGDAITGEERLLGDPGARIRDVRAGGDGNLYLLTDEDDGKLLRVIPPGR